jgi:hypothetical protein
VAVVLGPDRRGIRLGLTCHCANGFSEPLQPNG